MPLFYHLKNENENNIDDTYSMISINIKMKRTKNVKSYVNCNALYTCYICGYSRESSNHSRSVFLPSITD